MLSCVKSRKLLLSYLFYDCLRKSYINRIEHYDKVKVMKLSVEHKLAIFGNVC